MRRLLDRAAAPIDASSLGLFRVGFGLVLCVGSLRYFWNEWIPDLYLEPTVFFSFQGFEWMRPWPGVGMYVHYGVLAGLGAAVAAGAWPRVAAALYGLGFAYSHFLDRTQYLNHGYLLVLLCAFCAVLPVGRDWRAAGWWQRRRAGGEIGPVSTVPAVALWALRAQFALVYVLAGVAKLHAEWLLDAQPLRLWLAAHADWPVVGPLFLEPWFAAVCAWAGAIFDLAVPLFLLWRRTRAVAFAVVVLFHAFTGALFPIGVFPFVMTLGATLFFEPDWPRRLATLVRRRRPSAPSAPVAPERRVASLLAAVALAALGFEIALALPAYAHPGNLLWHERDFRFGYRVMVMEKSGHARFRVVERAPCSGACRTWEVRPRDYLTRFQAKEMATQPDMLVSFARFLAKRFAREHGVDVAVHADVFVSLNGRPAARFLDPHRDLASAALATAPWAAVLPAPPRR
jgi:vitamin K-dependent gamma-carboxylase